MIHKTLVIFLTVVFMVAAVSLFTACPQESTEPDSPQYAITFNANGGVLPGGAEELTIKDSDSRPIGQDYPPNPEREDYLFLEWRTSRNSGEGIKVHRNTFLSPIDDHVTAYAHWEHIPELPAPQLYYDFTYLPNSTQVQDLAGTNHGTLYNNAVLEKQNGIGIMYTGSNGPSSESTSTGWLDMGAAAGDIFETNEFTIATYVQFDSNLTLGGQAAIWAFSTDWGADPHADKKYPAMTFLPQNGKFAISDQGWADGHEQYVQMGTALPTGKWIHVLYTQSGTSGAIYIDGERKASGTTSHTITSVIGTGYGKFRNNFIARPIYADHYMTRTSYADFMIFDRTLSAAQITRLNIAGKLAVLNGK